MLAFYRKYPDPGVFVPQPVAQMETLEKVPQLAAQMPDSLLWSN